MSIKVGDFVFVVGKGLISNSIKIVSTGRTRNLDNIPSHVSIVAAISNGNVGLIEANFRGVRLMNLDTYRKYKIWFKRMKEPRDITKGMKWLHSQLGKHYDYTAIVGILTRSIFRLFGPKIYNRVRFMKNLLEKRTRFFCSEYVSKYGLVTGKALWKHPASVTTPYDLDRSEELYTIDVRWTNEVTCSGNPSLHTYDRLCTA